MIDWLTVRAFVEAPVYGGRILSIDPDGVIEWQCEKRVSVEGSHSSSVTVRRFPLDNSLEISGNPAKFFQGHNVFGSGDIAALSRAFVLGVLERIGYRPDASEAELIDRGVLVLSRIDTTESWDFGTLARARNAVAGLSQHSHLSHRGRGSLIAEGTCVWGKGSRRWNGKAYAKGLELLKHKLPSDLVNRGQVFELAQGLVRFEFTVRSMELKRRRLDIAENWARLGVTPESLHSDLMSQLTISDAAMVDTDTLADLPPRLQAAYQLWQDGHDLRAMYSRRTFYRYRAALLAFGIDVATVQPRERSNVVPLRVVLTGSRVGVPEWARGTSLYFEPTQIAA